MTYIIRTSDRMQFKSCRQKWDFGSKIRQNYEPIVGVKPLDFGTAIHAGLEAYYDPITWNHSSTIREVAAVSAFTATNDLQKDKYLTIHGDTDLVIELDTDFEERQALGVAMLEYYFTQAPKLDEGFAPFMTEVEFEVPILVTREGWSNLSRDQTTYFDFTGFNLDTPQPLLYLGEPVVYQGRVDLIMINEASGKYRIVDHKTRAQLGSLEFMQLDDQATSYGWALEHALGLDVEAVEFNELKKTAPHPPTVLKNGNLSVNRQQNTTYELFVAKADELGLPLAQYVDYLEFLQENPKEFVRRVVVRKTPKEYEIQGHRIFLEAIDMLDNPSIYPNPSPSYMGCPGCAFFNPCQASQDGGDVQYFLDEMFTKRKDVEANAEGK